ncbi:MAG: 3-deoxy-7-phosphoheptulonate synthase class II [Deltaproteobacteria bacterium]|nr:3-deoxy-7-phosphoheptulonate synthase class II [Deltaproteobacteria bacterium]
MKKSVWGKDSWKTFTAKQQVDWPDKDYSNKIISRLTTLPPLVFAGECRSLKSEIALAQQGKAFLLQGGDCAEEFQKCTAISIRETLKIILQMAVIMTYAGEKHVIKLGRIAGQYAKPRSSPIEKINGRELPSYRGDMVNSIEFTPEARKPDAGRLLESYFHSAATLNILRAFTKGGYASLDKVHSWNQEFVLPSKEGKSYEKLAEEIDKALKLMKIIGITPKNAPQVWEVMFYTSHEALLLEYEEALTRKDSLTDQWYDCSAHLLWIGDRTRDLDGAHVEFLSGVHNPLGFKIGPSHKIDDIIRLVEKLNPENDWGRITLITRFGKDKIKDHLPGLIQAIEKEGLRVLWSCDPMHGNTYLAKSNYKTRNFQDILSEIKDFFHIHRSEGTIPGGAHFELTGDNVTECIGGAEKIEDHHLKNNYATTCDPRLNGKQSLELAFLISSLLKE